MIQKTLTGESVKVTNQKTVTEIAQPAFPCRKFHCPLAHDKEGLHVEEAFPDGGCRHKREEKCERCAPKVEPEEPFLTVLGRIRASLKRLDDEFVGDCIVGSYCQQIREDCGKLEKAHIRGALADSIGRKR